MTEQQYKDLLIATAKMSDYEHKDEVVEALKLLLFHFKRNGLLHIICQIIVKSILLLALFQIN